MLKAVTVHGRLAERDADASRRFAIEDCHSSAMDGKRSRVRLSSSRLGVERERDCLAKYDSCYYTDVKM